jgi:membrane protein
VTRVWQTANVTCFFLLLTLLFALIFRYLPSVRTGWRTVWIGAAVTSALFELGQSVVAIYLARSGVVSTYGAGGSLVAILIWVYYTATVLLFGAEFTQVLAQSAKDVARRTRRR